ncbi:MAG: hypothetical protein JRI32_05460 [Deltaproteobacteria bacterium]|nr:hypothetical protein [Deltaproteobacteria bacterium]
MKTNGGSTGSDRPEQQQAICPISVDVLLDITFFIAYEIIQIKKSRTTQKAARLFYLHNFSCNPAVFFRKDP